MSSSSDNSCDRFASVRAFLADRRSISQERDVSSSVRAEAFLFEPYGIESFLVSKLKKSLVVWSDDFIYLSKDYGLELILAEIA